MTKRSATGQPAPQEPARMQPRHYAMRSALKLITMRMIACYGGLLGLSMGFASFASADPGRVIALPDLPFVIPLPRTASFDEWYTYRYNNARTGAQPYKSALSDPAKVRTLHFKWQFPPKEKPPAGGFKATPIVVDDTVFIGSLDGTFYALDAASGELRWQYPKPQDPPKRLRVPDPPWDYGIESSASFWNRPPNGAVIFGAQDPSLGPICPTSGKPCGSARLFALDAKYGDEIWPSELIATIKGDTVCYNPVATPECRTSLHHELHQRMFWSSPLIFNNKAYVGIHDFGDSPIQTGRVTAVDLASGLINDTFHFQAVGTPADPLQVRGGGVWNALAADGTGVYFTTGNTRIPWCLYPYSGSNCPPPVEPEPKPNHGLSMIRVDKDTGNVNWSSTPCPSIATATPIGAPARRLCRREAAAS